MTQDDRMETITDPALIRATDEPDERTTARYRALMAIPLDGPMMRGETTPAPVGAAVALDLDALGVVEQWLDDDEEMRIPGNEWGTRLYEALKDVVRSAREPGADPALVSEVRRLTVEAREARALTSIHSLAMLKAQERAESAEAEVGTLRANWRAVTTALGYGDGITEPQIGHAEFIAECEREFSEASEWRESQRWRDECHEAGHPDDEDCYEHDPALVLVTLRAKVAAVESLADQWADRKRSDGMSGNAWIGITLAGVAADLRAALATTGEGQ